MKKLILMIAAMLLVASTAMAVDREFVTLQNAATGTLGESYGSIAGFTEPMINVGCEVSSSPTVTVNWRVNGTLESVTSLPTHSSANAIISVGTCTVASCYRSSVGSPVTALQSVVSAATTTAVVKVKCLGTKPSK